MCLVVFICLLAYGSALPQLHLYIDRQQTNIGPVLGHMSTSQIDEYGPSHVIVTTNPEQEGEFYNISINGSDPTRFATGIFSAIGSGLTGAMSQWMGQLAGGMMPIIGDIGSSVAQAIAGGILGQAAGPAEDNDPVEDAYPGPASGAPYPVKPCKPKPTKPHKPSHKPLGYFVHVPQEGNYLVLHQPIQNSSQEPEKSNIELTGNMGHEGNSDENKQLTESTSVQQQTTEALQQKNDNTNQTITNV